jgi:RimJ/RimL family protein N-acetyltransferase
MFPDITRDDVFMLETPRLWLRWPRAADAPSFVRHSGPVSAADIAVMIPYPSTPEEADRFIFRSREANAAGAGLVMAFAFKGRPSEAIGIVRAEPASDDEIAIECRIAPAFRGRGLATEAVEAMLRAVFTISEAAAVIAVVRTQDPEPRRVLDKLGFRADGEFRDSLPADPAEAVERFRLHRRDWTLADVRISRVATGPTLRN